MYSCCCAHPDKDAARHLVRCAPCYVSHIKDAARHLVRCAPCYVSHIKDAARIEETLTRTLSGHALSSGEGIISSLGFTACLPTRVGYLRSVCATWITSSYSCNVPHLLVYPVSSCPLNSPCTQPTALFSRCREEKRGRPLSLEETAVLALLAHHQTEGPCPLTPTPV